MPNSPKEPKRGHTQARFLEDALAFSDDQVFVFDSEARFIYVNSAGLRLLDVRADDLIGRRWVDIGAAEATREPFHAAVYGVISLRRPLRGVIEVSANDVKKYYEYTLSPITGEGDVVESVIAVSRDITTRRQAEEALRADEYFNASLLRLYSPLGQSTTYAEIVEALKPGILDVLGFRNVHILIRGEQDSLLMLDTGGVQHEAIERLMEMGSRARTKMGDEDFWILPISGSPFLEELARLEDVYVIEDVTSHPLVRKEITEKLGRRTVVMVPLTLAENKLGFFALTTIGDEQLRLPDARQIDYLRTLANHVAVAIDRVHFLGERRAAQQALEETLDGIVGILASTVSLRDPYTTMHEERVARLACAIAKGLGLDGETIEGVRMAALLHDIGKISVPAEILSKPVLLSENETGIVRRHPALACELLERVKFSRPVATIVRQHHERLDGSGYPDGITGDDMLVESKILAVSDVVEAMSADRPYRPALGIDAALAEIEQHAGVLYDTQVVAKCAEIIRAEGRLP